MMTFRAVQQQEQTPAQLREQIREQVRKSVADAQAAARAAREQAQAEVRVSTQTDRIVVPTAPQAPLPPGAVVVGSGQGIGQGEQGIIIHPGERLDDIPPRAQELGMLFFVVMAVIIIGWPIARAIGRLIDRRGAAPSLRNADIQPQLQRIEQAVEAMSIEIERISESQRYLTKLQAGRQEEPLLVPRRPSDS